MNLLLYLHYNANNIYLKTLNANFSIPLAPTVIEVSAAIHIHGIPHNLYFRYRQTPEFLEMQNTQ